MTSAGLRERKKQRTRDALIDAAFTLFERKGFESTTIDEIAEAVEVSPRTFFRYFASKEDVVLTFKDQQLELMLEGLASRPAEESVLTAMRRAASEVVLACEAGEAGFDPSRFEVLETLLETSPTLVARLVKQSTRKIDKLVEMLADRMGVEPTDPRPILVASICMCAIQNAMTAWRAIEPDAKPSAMIDRVFELLAAGIDYPAKGSSTALPPR